MKRYLAFFSVALGTWMCGGACAQATQSSLIVLSQQAPNASAWVLAPLDQAVPPDIRQNLTFLREDLLDEGKADAKAGLEAYRSGHQLCNSMIAALDERDKALTRAGVLVAQANANVAITSQALEARRSGGSRAVTTSNGLTGTSTTVVRDLSSWTQYAREGDQREELRNQASNKIELANVRYKAEWNDRVAQLRTQLDGLYAQFRDELRKEPALLRAAAAVASADPSSKEPMPAGKPAAAVATTIPAAAPVPAPGVPPLADPRVQKMTERMTNTSWSWIHAGTEMTFLEGGQAVSAGQDFYKWKISESDPQLLEGNWYGRTFEFRISDDFRTAKAVVDGNREWTARLLDKNVRRKVSK